MLFFLKYFALATVAQIVVAACGIGTAFLLDAYLSSLMAKLLFAAFGLVYLWPAYITFLAHAHGAAQLVVAPFIAVIYSFVFAFVVSRRQSNSLKP